MGKAIDITGQRFGRLVAIRDIGRNKHRMRIWECICDCGNTTTARVYDLTHGETRSCGCLKLESLAVKREKWRRMRECREERAVEDRRRPLEITPITQEIKDSFKDWWMFGEKPEEHERWFESVVV